MRIGLVELLLILLIAALSIGPSAALWVERWMRRAQRSTAAAGPRRRPSAPPSGRKCSSASRS